jgi:hypothetical protein
MASTVIATVVSAPEPLKGQGARSSENFSIDPQAGTQTLTFKITDGADPDMIHYNVMQDKTMGIDPIILNHVGSDFTMNASGDLRNVYIASPSGATTPFVVTVYANS